MELWRTAPLELSLPSDRIDVWKVELDTPESSDRASCSVLSADEVSRAGRFHLRRDRVRFVECRTALRNILGRYLRVSPAEIRFRYEKNGKPDIEHAQDSNGLRFNVSHSSGLAVISVGMGCAVGVDVERFNREIEGVEIARRFFSKREYEALLEVSTSDRQRAFFACWTRKEAFPKAIGEGILYPLSEFSVSVALNEPPRLEEVHADPHAVFRWSMRDLQPGNGYLGTLVTLFHPRRLVPKSFPAFGREHLPDSVEDCKQHCGQWDANRKRAAPRWSCGGVADDIAGSAV